LEGQFPLFGELIRGNKDFLHICSLEEIAWQRGGQPGRTLIIMRNLLEIKTSGKGNQTVQISAKNLVPLTRFPKRGELPL
jgi:hypothetical protein